MAIAAQLEGAIHQQELLLAVMVDGVATEAGGAATVNFVRQSCVANGAVAADLGRRGTSETEQQGSITAAVYMIASGTVASFAALPCWKGFLE